MYISLSVRSMSPCTLVRHGVSNSLNGVPFFVGRYLGEKRKRELKSVYEAKENHHRVLLNKEQTCLGKINSCIFEISSTFN